MRIEVNGKALLYSSDALVSYRKIRQGTVTPLETMRTKESKYYAETIYVIPLEKKMEPGQIIRIKLIRYLPGVFSNMFELETAGSWLL